MQEVFVLSACRTAIGSFGGVLKDFSSSKLGSIVIKEAVSRAGIVAVDVEDVIMGNVLQAGQGQNPARQASLNAGINESVPAMTVNKVCGSGLEAVVLAEREIQAGDADCVIAGGMESMSNAPFALRNHRWGKKMGEESLADLMIFDGLWDIFNNYHMGITAENIAERYFVTRNEQDEFAIRSQQKAAKASTERRFAEEIVPVEVPQGKKGSITFSTDEYIKADTSIEVLSKLRTAFKENGTVTAGNSSGINDAAAALVLAGESFVNKHKLTPMAKIISNGSKGVAPEIMGMGPVPSIRAALAKTTLKLDDIDLFELNEAFAAQSIAVIKELNLNESRVNVNGGAIALGHPIGASGARILVTLLHEMKKRKSKYGCSALCIGGGMGEALIVENI